MGQLEAQRKGLGAATVSLLKTHQTHPEGILPISQHLSTVASSTTLQLPRGQMVEDEEMKSRVRMQNAEVRWSPCLQMGEENCPGFAGGLFLHSAG